MLHLRNCGVWKRNALLGRTCLHHTRAEYALIRGGRIANLEAGPRGASVRAGSWQTSGVEDGMTHCKSFGKSTAWVTRSPSRTSA